MKIGVKAGQMGLPCMINKNMSAVNLKQSILNENSVRYVNGQTNRGQRCCLFNTTNTVRKDPTNYNISDNIYR